MKGTIDTGRVVEEQDCRKTVCLFLGWGDMEYFYFQLECGITYLTHYLPEQWAVDIVKKSRVFWNWWRLHWIRRDKDFLVYCEGDLLTRAERLVLYRNLHDGQELSRCIRPTAVVLNESYAVMMQQLIDSSSLQHE